MNQIQIKQNDLTYGSFTLTPTGLTAYGAPKFEEWIKCGDFIQKANKSVHFWIGDWLNFGEGLYGETYTQAMDETKYALQTLSNDKWIASRIPSSRRRENLTFSHHAEVADLEAEEQKELLDVAEKNKLNTSEFRKMVRHYKLKMDLPELTQDQLKPTDPKAFEQVQAIIDASIHTIELVEGLEWQNTHKDAQDFFLSHLKRATGFYLSILKRYDKQKSISGSVV